MPGPSLAASTKAWPHFGDSPSDLQRVGRCVQAVASDRHADRPPLRLGPPRTTLERLPFPDFTGDLSSYQNGIIRKCFIVIKSPNYLLEISDIIGISNNFCSGLIRILSTRLQ